MNKSNVIVDFYAGAQDFLQLIGKKAKQARINTEAAKELEVLENFYEIADALIKRCHLEIHESRLLAANEHVKAKILEKEIREIYNELHKKNQLLLADVLLNVRTAIPSKAELMEEVHIKNQPHHG